MTPEQQTAADNALVEKLVAFDNNWHEATCVEAAERIKSLQAEVERLSAERDIAASWARGERTQAEADRQRMRDALEVADDAIREMCRYYDGGETRGSYDGKPERAQLRKAGYVTRAALCPAANTETNDG